MSLVTNTCTLFGTEEFWVLADSESFLDECSNQGLKTALITEVKALPRNSIIFSFSNGAAKLTLDIAQVTPAKRSVFCAAQVFEPSLSCASYSLNLLLNSDFKKALERQRVVLNMLNSHDSFSVVGNGSSGQVSLSPQAKPYALIAEDISSYFIHSVAEFFEVHYAHMKAQEPCPFSFSGKLKVSGILTVLRKPNPTLPDNMKIKLLQLSDTIFENGGLLTVVENKVTSLLAGNNEYIEVLKLAAGGRGLALTEFAIGVNEEIANLIDYKMNSQLNEGVGGVHLAIGDGSSGYHIDFLSPAVSVAPITQ
ncbi:hypothetical protein B1219_10380 [Pseudomonas ogarae]|uniref:hypothetical protein n=1 Tax=Pseudomonas ogarae (strain DSM 112162 / CECT 30235 / F113) TaxID=1114970 RepID=UPI0009A44378|nr:hypothetical protein [Pseudomonas ogarae]OPG72547.1 hypothetical protein B1219_10380 [Pseudomonas ogarae]OPG79825.1 hypothetical protein B1218_08360 [Pseudomonas ogarae]PBJ16319.1 hypothetical protein BSF43_01280 [Pseudomonas ogarae]